MQLQMLEHNLLLLPGLDGTGRLFGPLLSILPPEYSASVVAYPRDQCLSYKQLFPSIRACLPWTKPVTLVAESYSGPLALEFAAAEREHVRALVLVCTFVTNPVPTWLKWSQGLLQDSWFEKTPSETFLRKYLVGEDAPPNLVDTLLEAIKSIPPQVLAARVRQVLATDAREALQNCRKPILYLLGQQDKLLANRGWETMVALRPGMTTVALDGPHLLLQRKPREALAAIETFLGQLAK